MSKPTEQELLGVQTADDAEIYRREYVSGRWVSVHERLPEIDNLVLWYYPSGDMNAWSLDKDEEFGRPSVYGNAVWPSHWMELPEPPK